jgi:hypothetical protein
MIICRHCGFFFLSAKRHQWAGGEVGQVGGVTKKKEGPGLGVLVPPHLRVSKITEAYAKEQSHGDGFK